MAYGQILIGEINLPRESIVNANGQTEERADNENIIFGLLLLLRSTVEPNLQS